MPRIRTAASLALLLALSAPALAQSEQRSAPEWAPQWEVGDWWIVKLYQRDLRKRYTSPKPLDKGGGGEPELPDDLEVEPLPGFPVLRGGIPEGFKPANRFRFEVLRQETVRWEGENPLDSPPETFWVVAARTLDGEHVRRAELWFSVKDLSLAKVVLERKGKLETDQQRDWLRGTAQLDLPLSRELGFPLAWPDLHGAKQGTVKLEPARRPKLEQRTRVERGADKGDAELKRVRIYLRQAVAKSLQRSKDAPRARCRFTFEPKRPYWVQLATNDYLGVLGKSGKKGETPKDDEGEEKK